VIFERRTGPGGRRRTYKIRRWGLTESAALVHK
jgi:hypothetical protein